MQRPSLPRLEEGLRSGRRLSLGSEPGFRFAHSTLPLQRSLRGRPASGFAFAPFAPRFSTLLAALGLRRLAPGVPPRLFAPQCGRKELRSRKTPDQFLKGRAIHGRHLGSALLQSDQDIPLSGGPEGKKESVAEKASSKFSRPRIPNLVLV